MDPLTALSLASSIFQVIDFSRTLIQDATSIYRDTSGALSSREQLEQRVLDMRSSSSRLQVTAVNKTLSDDEEELRRLAKVCETTCQELLGLINGWKVGSRGFSRMVDSVKVAVLASRQSKKAEELQVRLDRIQVQVNTCLLCIIRNEQSFASASIHDLAKTNMDQHVLNRRLMDGLTQELISHLQKGDFLKPIIERLDALALARELTAKANSILDTLHIVEFEKRYSQISESFPETFDWIFEGTNDYSTWLQHSDGVFWISGKVGSGKSTLMKYLVDHPQTRQCVETWGGPNVVIANFFFWAAGSEPEKSKAGLMQSLLYQVLLQNPSLIQHATPRRWNADISLFGNLGPWTRQEVKAAFANVLQNPSFCSKFCFFIDGLDEFDGDDFEIVEELERVISSQNVKLCVSSRPHAIFKKAYGGSDKRYFKLEDLTRDDMNKYIYSLLETDKNFVELAAKDSSAWELVEEIRSTAHGVFLWVKVVVKSLRNGLSKDDTLATLRQRLGNFPEELHDLLEKVFNGFEPVYQRRAARVMIGLIERRLPGLMPCFIEQESHDPDYALNLVASPMSDDALLDEYRRSIHLVNNWTCGLLEAVTYTEEARDAPTLLVGSVIRYSFTHRTVYEFLLEKYRNGILADKAGPGFEYDTTALGYILHMSQRMHERKRFLYFLESAVAFQYPVNKLRTERQIRLFRELDALGQSICGEDQDGHWTNAFLMPELRKWFLPLARQFGSWETFVLSHRRRLIRTTDYPAREDVDNQDSLSFMLEIFLCTVYRHPFYQPYNLPAIAYLTSRVQDLNRPIPRGKAVPPLSIWQRYLLDLSMPLSRCRDGAEDVKIVDWSGEPNCVTLRDSYDVVGELTSFLLLRGADPFVTLPMAVIREVELLNHGRICTYDDAGDDGSGLVPVKDWFKSVADWICTLPSTSWNMVWSAWDLGIFRAVERAMHRAATSGGQPSLSPKRSTTWVDRGGGGHRETMTKTRTIPEH